jgi:sigma-B regulation protein RsbU (phosphoserine phosphatase)
MRPPRLQYILLALVAAVSLTCYFSSAVVAVEQNYDPSVPRMPMTFGFHRNEVSGNAPEAWKAGIRWGDIVTAVNGRPFTGFDIYLQELHKAKAGDPLIVTFIPRPAPESSRKTPDSGDSSFPGHLELTQDGPPRVVAIRLLPIQARAPSFLRLLVPLYFLNIVFPLGGLLLGFWVVLSKPSDRNAWFFLGILAYFSSIFMKSGYWTPPLYVLSGLWSGLIQGAGPLSIMLFGIYFPERAPLDRRIPWLKWIVIATVAAFYLLDVVWLFGFGFNFDSVAWLSPLLIKYFQMQIWILMIPIYIYFSAIARKAFNPDTVPDQRRRLKIIYWGSFVGSIPMMGVVLYALFSGRDFGDGIAPWLLLSVLFIFTLFPLSLAYAVVVHRAMELRVLLRQGSQYALAVTGIWVIRVALIVCMSYSISMVFSHNFQRIGDQLLAVVFTVLFFTWRFRFAKGLSTFIDKRFFRESYSSEQILAELAAQVQTFTDTTPLMDTVAKCIGDAMHIDRIAILLRTGDVFRLQLATGVNPAGFDLGSEVSLPAGSETISALSRAKGPAPNLRFDSPEDWAVAATDAERAALKELGAEILIPLPGRTRLSGVLALGPKRSEEPYSRADRSLLQSVALHTGLAIENSELLHSLAAEAAHRERINREMEIAREVQERMFPQTLPAVPGLDYAGHCRPALGVGGDYYDFFELPSGPDGSRPLGIAIGDVSGKGISAALLMASLRASLRGMTRTNNQDLAIMMREINLLVFEASTISRYATFFYAQFDPHTRILSYVNAGHNAPIVIRPTKDGPAPGNGGPRYEVLRLELTGPVVGLLRDAEFEQSSLAIQSGDILLAFTDGISESMTADEQEWGEDRMIACLQAHATLHADALLRALLEEATNFAAGVPQYDDMTLLVCKFNTLP